MNPVKPEITKTQELTFQLRADDAMTRDPVTVPPDMPITRFRELLRDKQISGAPVVEEGKLVGIISTEDLIKCLLNGELEATVGAKMTRQVKFLYGDEHLVHAVSLLARHGIGRLPILDRATGHLVGILTRQDIIAGLLHKLEIDYRGEEIRHYRASHIFEDIAADDVRLIFRYRVEGGNFDHAGESSSKLRTNLLRLSLAPDIVRRVAIATYEAEMNIVIYTPGGTLTAVVEREQVRIVARDHGPGIPDVEKAMTPGFSTAPDWVRELGFGAGMGLPNIKSHSDSMAVKSKPGGYTQVAFSIGLA
jgi:CBS domain-containing protein/anti-sigma regulatory factor (Ser/Thr protein kinase)